MTEPGARGTDGLGGDPGSEDGNHAMGSRPFVGHGDPRRLGEAMREVMDAPETHRRRSEVVERAVRDHGMDMDLAEYIYDIAEDEAIEPAFAFELVFAGFAVTEPEGTASDAEETLVAGAPEWVEEPPLPVADAQRERRLRTSFRRFRHLLESTDPITAANAYVEYPDVVKSDY
jgi:hypothetical protein